MYGAMQLMSSGTIMPAGGDPDWSKVTSLLHFDGADGSTTIVDVVGKTWTANGTAKLSTARSKFGSASLLLDGTGLGVSTANVSGTGPGTGDFTYEAFVYPTTSSSQEIVLSMRNEPQNKYGNALAIISGALSFSDGGTWHGTSNSVPVNQWSHVAASRSGGVLMLYVNGTQGYSGTVGNSFPDPDLIVVGAFDTDSSSTFAGNIDECRITTGVARYSGSTITVPTAPFPNHG